MDKRILKPYLGKETLTDNGNTESLSIDNKMSIIKILNKDYDLNIESYRYADLKKSVPTNFCLYPFIHLNIDPDGRGRPCCKYKVGDASWQQDVPKLSDVNIDDIWNQAELQELRSQFLKNEKPSGCKACWDEEEAGIPSMRKLYENGGHSHPEATFFSHIPRKSPKNLDLKLSNICNLKCRICTPFLSSQWIKEHKDLNISDANSLKIYTNNSKEKLSENIENFEILTEWARDINHLEFYGGEPLLQQEHDRVLDIIYQHGRPNITELFYNTNGTICEEKFFKIWKNFKEVTISLSVDDIGNRFEYQRKNAKWQEVKNNIDLFKTYKAQYGVNLHLQLYITVGIYNVFYLQEILEELKKFDLPVVFNMVHYPHHFSLVNLPNSVKPIIENVLQSIDTTSIRFLDWSPTIDNLIRYMNDRNYDSIEFNKFWELTELHDTYRKESFKNTFPELYTLLKEYI